MNSFEQKIANLKRIKKVIVNHKMVKLLLSKQFGVNQSNVEVLAYGDEYKTMMADRSAVGQDFYYYAGPIAERDFCVTIQRIDKVFSIDEINAISTLTGYDVFKYEPGPIMKKGGPGGPNCKHYWIKFRGKFINTPAPTNRQISNIVNNSIFN